MRVRFALLALLLVACHHTESSEPAPIKAADPCTLLSAGDVQRATGTAVREGETGGDENSTRRCTWHESGEGAGSVIIAIHVVNMDNLMGELRNFPGSEKLPAVADEAYWNNALNQLTMRTNGGIVTINFSSGGGATDHKLAAIEIAKILLPKLS